MKLNMKMSRFLGVFFLLFIFLSLSLAPVFAIKPLPQIVVGAKLKEYKPPTRPNCDINVPKQYATIQAAIDSASNGDTICVGKGTYNEDVSINKSVQLSGRGARKTIINGQDPNAQGTVSILVDNVTLEGFLINGVSTNLTQVAVAINGSDSGSVSEANIRYNQVVAGNGGIALRTVRVQNSIIQNNILEGNNSPYVAAEGGLDGVGSTDNSFISNTFIGTVSPNDRQDTGITLDAATPYSLVKQNLFNTIGGLILVASNSTSTVNANNFNSSILIKVATTWGASLNAENNWWGDLDPSDNVQGDVDYTPFATSPFAEN
ncbi:hypothetical protein HYU92_03635 [Candidatus Curtissbacteria bacterium]|nr:hypothetical protein [Candidatus Curtissbacteria bacterium]